MSIAYMYESRAEIRRLLVAGAKYAKDDFRLKRLAKELGKAGGKSPVFARAAGLLEGCADPGGDSEGAAQRLLDAGAFVSAVLFTQAATGIEGEWEPWGEAGDALVREAFGEGFPLDGPEWRMAPQGRLPGYRELEPVVTALTTKRTGRYQTIKDALESGLLLDYRLLPHLVGALSDAYAEIPPLCVKALTGIGRPALPMLLDGLDLTGARREALHRLEAIAGIAGKSGGALYRRAYLEGTVWIRAMAVGCMGGLEGMDDLIQAAAQDPSKEVRDVAERLLARSRPFKAIGATLFGKKKGG